MASSGSSLRMRYRIAKPKPNIVAGKRVVQFAPGSGPSAVNNQRGPESSNTVAAVSTNISTTPKEINTLDENSSAHRLATLNASVPVNEEPVINADSVSNNQIAIVASPVKTPEISTLKPSDKENVGDSTSAVVFQEPAPVKPRERRMSVREVEKESTRNRYKKGAAPPERDKMTMLDLIYWNPANNPMIEEDLVTTSEINLGLDADQRRIEESVDDPDNCGDVEADKSQGTMYGAMDDDDEESMPTPQVKIGPDGNIMLDEQSLVIQTSAAKKGLSSAPTVQERSSLVTYNSFRKRQISKTWSDSETSRFYMALSTVGTDFSMMSNLFPKRERHELKLKYKREEKYNKELVDKAIHEAYQYDLTIFEEHNSESENQVVEVKKRKKSTRAKKPAAEKKTKEKKAVKLNVKRRKPRLQEESDTEPDEMDPVTSVIESVASSKNEELEEQKNEQSSNDEEASMSNILKTTRSGRQPKQRVLYSDEKHEILHSDEKNEVLHSDEKNEVLHTDEKVEVPQSDDNSENAVNKELSRENVKAYEYSETMSIQAESTDMVILTDDEIEHSYATYTDQSASEIEN